MQRHGSRWVKFGINDLLAASYDFEYRDGYAILPGMKTTHEDTVYHRFFAPLLTALERAHSGRSGLKFTDKEFLLSGVGRVIASVQSGRDWVQYLQMQAGGAISVANFFATLKSPRRLRLLEEVALDVRRELDESTPAHADPLAAHPELDGFAVYGSDGHYEKPSAHEKRIEGKKYAPGYFFALSLRSHSLALLDIARPERKKENDVKAMKRLGSTALRLGAPKGVKVIHAYDPAIIDYHWWYRCKAKGVYFVSREKENSAAEGVGENAWDRNDPRNTGVLSDELVGVFAGVLMRRVRYCDPVTGEIYSYMTSELNLPPGLIAFIYKLRWDVEKVFDEKKNKLLEQKAWAKTKRAKCQQAHFIALAHNLMVCLERDLQSQEGIVDDKSIDKKRKRLSEAEEIVRQRGLIPNPLVQNCLRITERSLQFIRWLRYTLGSQTLWTEAVTQLRPLMAKYLA